MVQGGGKDQQRRRDSSNGRAACRDSLISSHGVFVSVVGLESGLVCELHVEGVHAAERLPLRQTLDSFAFGGGVSVNS
jgi:hypothetical protein